MDNYQKFSLAQILQNLTNYAQLIDQQTKVGQKIKKTNLNILIIHMKTIKCILDYHIKYQNIIQQFKNLEDLLKKLQIDWKNTEYSQIKQLNSEEDLQKNLVYLTYHLQNPQVPLELAYSIFQNKNYEFLQISINNKYDKLALYQKAQIINKKHLQRLQNLALKGIFQIIKNPYSILVCKDNLKIKLGVSIYNLNNVEEKIYWIVLDLEYQQQKVENNVQIVDTINSIILHILQNSSKKEKQKIDANFYDFVFYFVREIFKQDLIYKIFKLAETKDSLIHIQEHIANNTRTHKCYKILLTKNIKNKYYFYLMNVLNFSIKETLDLINWNSFDFQQASRVSFCDIHLKPSIPLYELSSEIKSLIQNKKIEFTSIRQFISEQKQLHVQLPDFHVQKLIEEMYQNFYPIFVFKLYEKLKELNKISILYFEDQNFTNTEQNETNIQTQKFYENLFIEIQTNQFIWKITNLNIQKILKKDILFNLELIKEDDTQSCKQIKKELQKIIKNNF